MKKLGSAISSVDWDDFFGYSTPKEVRIRDRRLGFLYLVGLLLVIFVIGYVFLYLLQGWARFDQVAGALQPPTINTVAAAAYCDPVKCQSFNGTEAGCGCLFMDAADLVFPQSQESSLFITTKVALQVQEAKINPCVGGICTQSWTAGATQGPFNTVAADTFIINVNHEGFAPIFFQEEVAANGGVPPAVPRYSKKSQDLFGRIVNFQGVATYTSQPGVPDRFPFSAMLAAANVNYANVVQTGALLSVLITYGDCRTMLVNPDATAQQFCAQSVAKNGDLNYYQYSPVYIPGSTYTSTSEVLSADLTMRTIRSFTGVRLAFLINGRIAQFSILSLLQTFMISYILVSVLNFVMDVLVMYIIPGKALYRRVKIEKTQNFNELRKQMVMEENMKKKIETVTKVARYSEQRKVDELLDSMKPTITDTEFDQLVLACLEVYANELRDEKATTRFFDKLRTEEGKFKANLALRRLKDAYLIAAKMDSQEKVQSVLHEARADLDNRVVGLCEQYLANKEKDSVPKDIELKIISPSS